MEYVLYQSCGCINLQQNKLKNAINGMNLICSVNPNPPFKIFKLWCLPKGKKFSFSIVETQGTRHLWAPPWFWRRKHCQIVVADSCRIPLDSQNPRIQNFLELVASLGWRVTALQVVLVAFGLEQNCQCDGSLRLALWQWLQWWGLQHCLARVC